MPAADVAVNVDPFRVLLDGGGRSCGYWYREIGALSVRWRASEYLDFHIRLCSSALRAIQRVSARLFILFFPVPEIDLHIPRPLTRLGDLFLHEFAHHITKPLILCNL